jgi:hypothetical protein
MPRKSNANKFNTSLLSCGEGTFAVNAAHQHGRQTVIPAKRTAQRVSSCNQHAYITMTVMAVDVESWSICDSDRN